MDVKNFQRNKSEVSLHFAEGHSIWCEKNDWYFLNNAIF